jgi:prophage regulatory protein
VSATRERSDLGVSAATPPAPLCLLRLPAVRARVGLGRTAIYDGIAAGTFPAPIRLGRRCVAWPSTEIDAWIAARIAEARPALAREAR